MFSKAFWAKKSENKGKMEWLPLYIHLEDTRNIIGLLWNHWLSPGQRNFLQEATELDSEEEVLKLVRFVGASHDIAKATPAFQMMKGFRNSRELDEILLEKLRGEGLLTENSIGPLNPEKSHHSLAGYLLLKEFGVQEDISCIIGAHHGRLLVSSLDRDQLKSYPTNYFLEQDQDNHVRKRWEEEQKKIFIWALESSGYETVGDLPEITQAGQVLLSGLLIMADWIASNEDYFPLIDIEEENVQNKEKRLQYGWEEWHKSDPWEPDYILGSELYKARFDFDSPRNMQKVFAETVDDIEDPGIIILEAPMGLGKTEAALVGAEILARNMGRSGVFFGLPTQATSDGMFPRIESWLETIVAETHEDLPIRLEHGKSALNENFRSLAKNVDIDASDKSWEGSVIVNEWFSGRKTSSLDDFVVGTVDHFLLNALKQKHLALRHLGFSKKVVIIDEVHAYDAYMSQYLNQSLRWMGAYGVPVIILSATLSSEKREEMVEQYLRGKNLKKKEMVFPDEGLRTTAYPLITYNDGVEIKQETNFEKEASVEISVVDLSEENLEDLILTSVEEGANVGFVVNTVKRAQEMGTVFKELLGDEKVEILHSSFISTHRIKKERELLSEMGKNGKRPYGKLYIGTQVIEQSLDIDFDLMISDLAPMDLLIQRIGRLHRHEETLRPKNYKKPKFFVLGLSEDLDFNEGSEAVYGGYLLSRTQFFLSDKIILPDDISRLVQKVYGEEEIKLKDELQTKYLKMKSEHEREIEDKKHRANGFKLEKPSYKNRRGKSESLVNWLERSTNFESEERAFAQVRDIDETIEVIALKKIGSGYGIFGTKEDLSSQIRDRNIAQLIAKENLRLPIKFGLDEIIKELEKRNLEKLLEWQETSWLKGSLGVVFDESNEYELENYKLIYSEELGLVVERK